MISIKTVVATVDYINFLLDTGVDISAAERAFLLTSRLLATVTRSSALTESVLSVLDALAEDKDVNADIQDARKLGTLLLDGVW